ncbi:SKI family transcriptional corepressor 2 isoform X2 [Hyla sarda]|uniref:SKI family transcriptional corepressor 2 isoform X2 n=1 Tax=Hyla sarda TaxID=327740 RepID=UPI0024C2942B|nr:SKI family transcriptional corepressor 2 isoform X2 [Hyla sarda]
MKGTTSLRMPRRGGHGAARVDPQASTRPKNVLHLGPAEMATSPLTATNDLLLASPPSSYPQDSLQSRVSQPNMKPNQVSQVILYGIPIVSLVIDGQERLCLAQISNTLLKNYSYNEIHNRRVALGITCVQCTPVQLEILRRAGAMPISSRRCGMITKREAERLCKSFLGENRPPKLPDNFAFDVSHECAWGCRGNFIPARYNSSRAKCIKCTYCNMYFSPNKFIFHSHRTPDAKYTQPDAANFNSWRRHLKLSDKTPPDEMVFAWEDVKAMFNGGSRKRALSHGHCQSLGSIKASNGILPHMIGQDLNQKRPRFEEEEEIESTNVTNKTQRSYPVIPVPSKGFGMLQKFPASTLFPSPYTFPAFGLCQKKDDADAVNGQKTSALSGLFWPGRKDAFYPPFCMFWPPRTPGGLPVPTYLQPQPSALTSITDNPTLRQAFLELADQTDASNLSNTGDNLFETECSSSPVSSDIRPSSEARTNVLDVPSFPIRKQNYHSAFRPVVKDTESIAKLHGNLEDFQNDRHVSPGTSCSYQSDSSDSDEEQDVDVETNKPPGEEEEEESLSSQFLQSRGLVESNDKDRSPFSSSRSETQTEKMENAEHLSSTPKESSSPRHTSPEEPGYKDTQKSKDDNGTLSSKEDSYSDKSKEMHFYVTESDTSTGEFWREIPEELQKVLFEQIDLRRRLEQEFQVLKGTPSFPVFNNFHDQMKRELAYREEMVQQLQIIPYAASLIRKEKLGTHLSKS